MSRKPIAGEGQMQMDYTSVEPKPQVDSESNHLLDILKSHGATEAELEELAETLGSYDLAYDILGISKKELDSMGEAADYPTHSGYEESVSGVYIKLCERAPFLLDATKQYSEYSKRRGLVDGFLDGRPDLRRKFSEKTIEKVSSNADNFRHLGALAVRRSYRLKRNELIQAGFQSAEIDAGEEDEVPDFKNQVVGSKNKNRREKLKKSWKNQEKNNP